MLQNFPTPHGRYSIKESNQIKTAVIILVIIGMRSVLLRVTLKTINPGTIQIQILIKERIGATEKIPLYNHPGFFCVHGLPL